MNLKESVNDYLNTSEGDGLHDKLMGVAQYAYSENPDCRTVEGLEEYLKSVMAQKFGTLDKKGLKDCHNTAKHAIEERLDYTIKQDTSSTRNKSNGTDYSNELKEWRELQSDSTSLYNEVKKQDVREDRIMSRTVLKELFKKSSGHVWHGATIDIIKKDNWLNVEDLNQMPPGSKYISLCTFGDKTKENEEGTVYERNNDNVNKVSCILIEMDAPLVGEHLTSEQVKALPEEDRKQHCDKILKDTCLIVERAGLKPTTITFSGTKSFHCLFRLETPIDAFTFHSQRQMLKDAYTRIGADWQVLTLSRCTRMPLGCRQEEAKQGDCQRLMYFNPNAEMPFNEIVEKLVALADSICPVKESKKITLPVFKQENENGKATWIYSPVNWWKFLDDIHLKKVWWEKEQKLMLTDENGISRWLEPEKAVDEMTNIISGFDVAAGANFVHLRSAALSNKNLAHYARNVIYYNPPKDTSEMVLVPFKNGMLTIKKDGIELNKNGYLGYDIMDDSPTVGRKWNYTTDKSEFQVFLERVCGKMNSSPIWEDRYNAIVTLIGYLVSRKKEAVNYLNILVEESIEENNGGTGKSIIMESVGYWRKRYFKDMKNYGENSKRFFWAGVGREKPDYLQMDDLPKNIDLQDFYSMITGELTYEKKGIDEDTLKHEDLPKLVAATNYYPKGSGNSNDRRIRIFEVSNYYRGIKPEKEFGHLLYYDWDEAEWARFDSFIARCVANYLKYGLHQCMGENSKEKKLDANLGVLKDFFDEKLQTLPCWCISGDLLKDYSEWYKNTYGQYSKVSYSAQTIAKKLKEYCEIKGLNFDNNGSKTRRHDGKVAKWILITDPVTAPVTETVTETVTDELQASHMVENETVENDFIKAAPDFTEECNPSTPQSSKELQTVTLSVTPKGSGNEDDTDDVTGVTDFSYTTMNKKEEEIYSREDEKNGYNSYNGYASQSVESGMKKNTSGVDDGFKTFTVLKRTGETFDVKVSLKPETEPWWLYNGVLMSFTQINDGDTFCNVAYCKGRIPEPIDGRYQILGSYYKAKGIGQLDEKDPYYFPVVFVVV